MVGKTEKTFPSKLFSLLFLGHIVSTCPHMPNNECVYMYQHNKLTSSLDREAQSRLFIGD